MTLQWALGWWNLVYLVPFAIALTYLAVYVSTGIGVGDGSADTDADAGTDTSADAHADASADHGLSAELAADAHVELDHDVSHDFDADHDIDHDTHHDHHAEAHAPATGAGASVSSLLPLLGLGRVPTTLFALIFLIAWGISGFATNQVLHKTIEDGTRVGFTSLPIAIIITLATTALLSRLIARTMPMNEPASTALTQLVGKEGVAVLPITDAFGLVKVHGHSGVSVQVPCRLAPGQPPVSANESVRLMRFDKRERVFYVTTPARLAELNLSQRS